MFPIRMYPCTGTRKTVYIHRVQLVTVQAGPHSGTVCHQKCCVLYKLLFVAILFVAKWIRTSLKKTNELESRALPMVRSGNLNLPPYRIPPKFLKQHLFWSESAFQVSPSYLSYNNIGMRVCFQPINSVPA